MASVSLISCTFGRDFKTLNNASAILCPSADKGQMVMFGWNPMHRHLNHNDRVFVYKSWWFFFFWVFSAFIIIISLDIFRHFSYSFSRIFKYKALSSLERKSSY
jgi:hypothetical protein